MDGVLLNPAIGFARGPGESSNPHLWRGLKLSAAPCLGFVGKQVPDLSPSRVDMAMTGTAYSIGMSPIGPCLTFTGNAALQQAALSWGLPCKFMTNSYDDVVFIHGYFKYNHSAGGKESTLFWSDNPTIGSPTYGYRLFVDNNADKLKLMISNNDTIPYTPTFYTSAATLTGGKWYHVIVGWWPQRNDTGGSPSDCVRMWIDNKLDDLPTVTNSQTSGVEEYCSHLSTQNARIGAALGSTSPDCSVALIEIWNRGLAEPEIIQLILDPLSLYRQESGAAYGKRPPILGSATLTEDHTVTCIGTRVQKSGGSLINENTISCTARRVHNGASTLINEHTLASTGTRVQKGSTLLQGDATFTCTGRRVQKSGCSLIEEFSTTCAGKRVQSSGGVLTCESSLACMGTAVFKGAATLICEAYLLAEVGEVYDVWEFNIAMRSELQDLYGAGVGVAREVVAESGVDTVVVAGTGRSAEHVTRTELEFSCER